MNSCQLIGNIGNEIELRTTPGGKYVCTLNLAVRDDFNRDKTHWFSVVLWEKQAELAHQYLHKGSKIGVVGSLQHRSFEDKSGNKRNTVEVLARHIEFLDSKEQSSTRAASTAASYAPDVSYTEMSDDSDDLPF